MYGVGHDCLTGDDLLLQIWEEEEKNALGDVDFESDNRLDSCN